MKSSYQLLQETLTNISKMDITDIKIVNQMTSMILEGAKPKNPPFSEEPLKNIIEAAETRLVGEIFERLDKYISETPGQVEFASNGIEVIKKIYGEIDNNMKSIIWNDNSHPENTSCARGPKCAFLKWSSGGTTIWMEMETFVLDPYPTLCRACKLSCKETNYINFQTYYDEYIESKSN
jgi:hypothetical protein